MQSQKKVLIIDDEKDLCLLLKSYFIKKNLDVTISHTLQDGLSKLRQTQPDIVFIDNNLPDGNGWDTATSIVGNYPQMYLILISAFHPSTPDMPLNTHFQRIDKPISLTDLDKRLAAIQIDS